MRKSLSQGELLIPELLPSPAMPSWSLTPRDPTLSLIPQVRRAGKAQQQPWAVSLEPLSSQQEFQELCKQGAAPRGCRLALLQLLLGINR